MTTQDESTFQPRRAVSGIVTGLIAVVAVLSTAIFFMVGTPSIMPLQSQDDQNNQPEAQAPTPTQPVQQPQEQLQTEVPQNPNPPPMLSESIRTFNAHIWVTPNGTSSVGAFVVQNTGDTTVSISKITVRGQSVPTGSWWFNNDPLVATISNVQRGLTYDGTLATIEVTGAGPAEMFALATGPLSLEQGDAMILYFANPAGIAAIDSGLAFTMSVQAGKASAVESVSVINGS